MKVLDKLKQSFPPVTSIEGQDKYTTFHSRYEASVAIPLDVSVIQDLADAIPPSDTWVLSVTVGNADSVTLTNPDAVSHFVTGVEDELRHAHDVGIAIDFEIFKHVTDGKVNIYDFESFGKFVDEKDVESFLQIIKDDLMGNRFLYFLVLDNPDISFYSEKLLFLSANKTVPMIGNETVAVQNIRCDFNRRNEYPFSANAFKLIERPNPENSISKKLDNLFCAFLISGIFDITSMDENYFSYKINGFRMFEGKVPLNELNLQSADTYFSIYQWIYSEPAKTVDKLGLARNILSIYLAKDSLEIESNAYPSLLSGFNAYLQENLNKYIEVRSKINDDLYTITEKCNAVINEYLGNYQKSVITVITFFISVFVLRFFASAKPEGLFNKEATILSLAFLTLSFIYLFVTLVVLNMEKNRLIKRYSDLKERFKDILIDDDIKKILRGDSEFNSDLTYFRTRRTLYTVLWTLTLLILLIAVISLSNYLNWQIIIDAIRG